MGRIRTIKPSLWTDETLAACSPIARLLFVASLNFADDNGNLERSARQLKAQAFPYDNIDCEPLIAELVRAGLLIEYEVGDRKYLHIKGFLAHQRIDRPSKCSLPVYDPSMSTRRALDEPSTSPRSVREGKVREGRVGEGKVSARRALGEPSRGSEKISDDGDIEIVFEHWRTTHGHPQASLDEKRRGIIRKALKHYSAATLCQSVTGYTNSPHHMGQNDRATKYDSIELLLSDAKRIDAGLKFYAEPPSSQSALTRKNQNATADWVPPEMRIAKH